jgi:hypothetical protein
MQTFQKEITFLSKEFDESKVNEPCKGWVEAPITKIATFKELSRTDKSQHKLHFKIIAIFEHFGVKEEDTDGENLQVKIDSDGVYDLTVKAINTLIIPDPSFTMQDKAELLNDSAGIFQFGFWLLGEKIAPFFSKFNGK